MEISKYFLFSLFALFIIVGCGNSHQKSATAKIDIPLTELSTLVDPVCKMSLEHHAIADTTTYEGKIYGFCNSGCKESFLEDPAKYVANL